MTNEARQLLHRIDDLGGGLAQALSGSRNRDRAAMPVEQDDAKIRLDLPDQLRHR
ncbi:MAG: hypothetical protein ABI564_14145 [Ideonella sp.]